jgi:hypothetical protein
VRLGNAADINICDAAQAAQAVPCRGNTVLVPLESQKEHADALADSWRELTMKIQYGVDERLPVYRRVRSRRNLSDHEHQAVQIPRGE